jgi:hypothetical protein
MVGRTVSSVASGEAEKREREFSARPLIKQADALKTSMRQRTTPQQFIHVDALVGGSCVWELLCAEGLGQLEIKVVPQW